MDSFEKTEKKVVQIEKKLTSVYTKAQKDISKEWKAYIKKVEKDIKPLEKAYEKAKKSGDKSAIDQLGKELEQAKKSATLQNSYYKGMVDMTTKHIADANQTALAYVNNEMPWIYTVNYNDFAQKGINMGVAFNLVDESTVQRMVTQGDIQLPKKKIDIPKDKRWNTKQINSQVLQGIVQGESLSKISDRIFPEIMKKTDLTGATVEETAGIIKKNEEAARRNARTMVTGAQNGGRYDSYKRAERLGIKLNQVWVATLDSRTRASHALMDGEERKVGEQFSNGLEYPGDPSGDPSEVYNCRCRIIAQIEGVDFNMSDTSARWNRLEGESYEDWKVNKAGEVGTYRYIVNEAKHKQGHLNKTFYDIWKTPVSPKDYMAKKDSIPKKREYYEQEIEKAKLNGLAIREMRMRDCLDGLDEFERMGIEYARQQDIIDAYQLKLKDLLPASGGIDESAFSELRRSLAKRFGSGDEADIYYRQLLDAEWDKLTRYEKYSIWQYTRNSNPMNQVLSGYNDGWSRNKFVGLGNTDWGIQDDYWNRRFETDAFAREFGKNGTMQPDYTKTISELTKAIDKVELKDDVFVVRGSDNNGLAGLFEGDLFSYDDALRIIENGSEEEIKAAFEGQVFQGHSFLSTGVAEGTGFGGEVSYSIYVPKGTHAIYAEPQSYFGGTIGSKERIYEQTIPKEHVGIEAELIIQRGTKYRVRNISKSSGWMGDRINIELEVVEQPNYFLTGLEETFNNGATIHIN